MQEVARFLLSVVWMRSLMKRFLKKTMHGLLLVALLVIIPYTLNQGLPAMQSQTPRNQEALSCAIATSAHDSLEAI